MQLYNVFTYSLVRGQLIANTVLVAGSFFMVILRFVSQRIRKSNLWWDDFCCVLALLHTFGMLSMQYYYAAIGMRHQMAELPAKNQILIVKILLIYQFIYYNAMVLSKFTYLFFYLRIFVSKEFRILTWACMAASFAYWLGSTLQVFLLCIPFEKNWDVSVPGHCGNRNVAFSTIGAFNLITDVAIILLPMRFIWKLQMSLSTKLALLSIFGLGAFISSITIIRIHVMEVIDFSNLAYSMTWAAFWSVTEPSLAVSNSCAPMIRPVIRAAFPRFFPTANAGYSGTPPTGGSGAILSKNHTSKMNEMDSEFPLTQLVVETGSLYEGSLNDQSQDGHSQDAQHRHFPTSVIVDHLKLGQ
ncbi:hypothetical protein N7495_006190 [Penicillium taxi]|uniref:uncharacterized protein n=1 Tax=Penicillium taxi TaxID=168475 RepID=UPI002544FA9F|nr:uncharacterized protein N7495_006190 [Penicillium taxi]KAJ5894499.1 hypothetical protein N7495_006190 [Penicillium taxi]